jgi:hypothetical protein
MRIAKLIPALAAAGIFLAANAGAASITFQMTVPNASGVNNGVGFTNQTVSITMLADTSQVAPVAGGNCVPVASTSIVVGGGAALQAVAPVFFCSLPNAGVVGVFTAANISPTLDYFAADYSNAGITNFLLASNFPLTTNVPGNTATAAPLNLAGGGTASLTAIPRTGTTFSASLGSNISLSVPTLSPRLTLMLAALVVGLGMVLLRPKAS